MNTKILLDATNKMPELRGAPRGLVETIAALPRGTTLGKTSIALSVRLDDGKRIFVETSLAHLQLAVAAFTAHYGDETGEVGIATNQTPKERQ